MRNAKTFKIEGEAFKLIKKIRDGQEYHEQEAEKARKAMWEELAKMHAEIGNPDKQHSIDIEYEDQGVYFVKETSEERKAVTDLLTVCGEFVACVLQARVVDGLCTKSSSKAIAIMSDQVVSRIEAFAEVTEKSQGGKSVRG